MIEQKRKPIGILLTVILISALLTVCLELGLSYLRPDTPGSIPKHLIHFAVMIALLGGATLLCLFCPPFKKLWAWLDQHIMTAETRPIAIDITYAVLAGLMLLHHFYVLLYYPAIPAGATKFAPIWIILAALTVILGKSWREVSFRIAAIFLIFTFERLYIKSPNITGNDVVYFASAIYALFICLNIFSTLHPSVCKPFLQILCATWTTCTIILSFTALYSIWTGIQIKNLVATPIMVIDGRLEIFASAPISASNLSSGIIISIIGFTTSKRKSIKVLYLLSCFIIMIANSLTDARASFFALAFMIAGTLFIGIWTIFQSKEKSAANKKKTVLVVAILLVCFSVSVYCIVETQRYLGVRFIEFRNNGKIFISTATAEDISENEPSIPSLSNNSLPSFEHRNIWISEENDINKTLSNRLVLWQRAFNYIQKHPETLLYGYSINRSVSLIVNRLDHSHSLLIQIILEGGIPSLLLFFALITYGLFHAFRLWNRKGVPFWQRIIPLPIFSILLWEMVECLTHFAFGHPPMTLLWFFLGATITVGKSLGKAPKSPEIPAESAASINRE